MASTDTVSAKGMPKPGLLVLAGLASVLALAGLAGLIGEGWGYGLLLIATLLLGAGVTLFGIFVLTKAFDDDALRRAFSVAFWLGGWGYVLAVATLSGHFIHETFQGRMELRWIIFGPVVLATLIVLDWGLYRILVGKNKATWNRYGHVVTRERIDTEAMRRTLVDEVIVHRSLLRVSPFRWVRHQLIFWGFGLMFAVEIVAVFVREGMPAFGMRDIWEEPTHPVRLMFDFAYDITGLMVMVGCVMALVFRLMVNNKPERKYADTPTAVYLLIVVVSGFVVEGGRIAATVGEAYHAASPVGWLFAVLFPWLGSLSGPVTEGLWLFHVLASCAFIAYVPLKRLIHSCATPMGRLMNSQKGMLAAKKEHSIRGLFQKKSPS